MATIPTPEAIFYAVYQSLCGSDYGSNPRKKNTSGTAELKSQLQKTEEILDAIFRALKLKEIDDRAIGAAKLNIMDDAANAYKEVEVHTFTYDASLRKIIWDLLGYLYVPGVARIIANWNLEEPLDKDMPSGRFWYLPEVDGETLKLPVAQVVDWYLDLLGMPLEKFAAERMAGLLDAEDNTSESMIRSLYKWKNGTLPKIDIFDAYFPDNMAIKYKGTFETDAGLNEDEQFAKAMDFVNAKELSAEDLQMEINISDLDRIQRVISGKADNNERRNFVEKLANRYAAPTPARVRHRLLIARMVQDGYKRLRKFLLPDVADSCADPEVNKLVQLILQFKLVYNLTTEASITQGHLGENVENQWFEETLQKTMLDPEVFLSILPSQRAHANLDLSKVLSQRFQKPSTESPLPNLLHSESQDSMVDYFGGLKEKYEKQQSGQTRFTNLITDLESGNVAKALADEDRYDMLFAAAKHSGMQRSTYDAIFQRIFELELPDYQYMDAWLFQTECFMDGYAPKEMVALAFKEAKAHTGYDIWKGPLLHLEGKHLINCNDFNGAIACFKEAEKDCQKRNYGPLRGLLAQDLFATEIANQRLNVNNHQKYYRDIINFGTHGGAELASVEELAAFLSHYFWNELYQPYAGVPRLRPRSEKETQELLGDIAGYLWKADSEGLEKWVKKNRQRLQKHLPDVRGDTVLTMLVKMWNGFRGDRNHVPLLLQAQIPTAFRAAISTISVTAPKLLKMIDFKGQTPLMLIAEQGEAKIVKTMIEAGADPAAQDYRGRSALHASIMNGHHGVIDVLLEHPECAIKTTIDGRTPAHSAITVGDAKTLEKLLAIAPALLNADSTSGTPLKYATMALENYEAFSGEFKRLPPRPGFSVATRDQLDLCIKTISLAQ